MDWSPKREMLVGSRVQYRETDEHILLDLPARPGRLRGRFGLALAVVAAFLLVVAGLSNGWFPAVLLFGTLACLALAIAFLGLADSFLTRTWVLVTADRAVVTTSLYGKETRRDSALDPRSRARPWYKQSPRGSDVGRRSWPGGIVIGPEPADREMNGASAAGPNLRFGESLSRGEMDWIGWKINQFLVRGASGVPPADQPVPRPRGVKIRIEEGGGGARIVFPNTVKTRTFAGVGNVLYLGLAMPAVALPFLVRWCRQIQTPWGFAAPMFAAGLLSLIAIAALLNGLTQLFGRRELRITPKTITYRAALLGLGLRTTVPTALVISIGVPPGQGRVPSGGAIAPAQGCVIRTAERELSYSAAVPKGEGPWIMDEVARRVTAVRTSTAMQER